MYSGDRPWSCSPWKVMLPWCGFSPPAIVVERRALAGPVHADQRNQLALRDGEGNAAQRGDCPVADEDVVDIQDTHVFDTAVDPR